MIARIYRPSKTAMQSGLAKTRDWVLVFEPESAREVDPLMGWTSSSDMLAEVKLSFDTKEQAVAYAKKMGLAYRIHEPHERAPQRKTYADNFRANRKRPWSH
jgi:hypothetical protein